MSSLNTEDIESFIQYIGNPEINLSEFNDFIDPAFWAILKSKLLLEPTFKIIPCPKNSRSYQYFLKLVGKLSSDTTMPLEGFNSVNRDDSDGFAENFVNLMNIDDKEDKQFIQYIIRELLTNTIDHAESKTDIVCCGQLFPRKNEIEIIIIDAGIGFKETISRKYKETKSDEEAISKAIEAGITGAVEEIVYGVVKNAGYGLYVVSQMVEYFSGSMLIISKNGFLKKNADVKILKTSKANWDGSIVLVKLPFHNQNNLNFNDFLKRIRKCASKDELF